MPSTPEQLPLDFHGQNSSVDTTPGNPTFSQEYLEAQVESELQKLYHQKVGKDPKVRLLNRERLIKGILNPASELDQLAAEDRASDQEEREKHWSN